MHPSLLLRMVGTLAFVGTALSLAGAGLVLVYSIGRRDSRLARRAAAFAGTVTLIYASLLFAGPLLARRQSLPPGAELSFCGFDCHLHVSAAGAWSSDALDVTLRFRSDAKRAPEYPARLRIRAIDAGGRQYAPESPLPPGPLEAGDTVERRLRFRVPADAGEVRLLVSWSGLDYLVPGPGNPLVQRRASLQLATAGGLPRSSAVQGR